MKTYIWSLPTRVFHSCLVLFIVITYISGDDDYLKIHSVFGYGIGVLILFRLLWGKIGPKYSNFKDFNLSFKEALNYSKDILLKKDTKIYAGHNPAASFVLYFLLITIGIVVLTGLLALGEEPNKGYFKFLNTSIFEDIHEIIANLMLILIAVHISGVLLDRFLHKEHGTLQSIVFGYKNISGESVVLSFKQKIVSFLFFCLMLFIMYLTATDFDHLF
ncbi:MAG: cytochrome b/b6 domain-containing protein [Campylobacteraceae bacterium]|nr:cytochrome b/b6 domain-containing protein [Campylobacteraceae bacterium]